MKNRIINIILVVCLLMTLSVNVSAASTTTTTDVYLSENETWVIEFNDDYSEVYIDGETYYSINEQNVMYDQDNYHMISSNNIIIEGVNSYDIVHASIYVYVDNLYINITIDTLDGSYYDKYYLNAEYRDEYLNIVSGNVDEAYIQFDWPEDNSVNTSYSKLTENDAVEVELYDKDGYPLFDNYFSVYSNFDDVKFGVETGHIYMMSDGEYYYRNKLENREYINANGNSECYYMHPITDERLLSDINAAYDIYIGEFEIFDDELPLAISKVFFTIIFALFPFTLAVLAVILLIKLPKKYRKILITLLTFSILEIIVFIGIALMLF